MLIQDGARRHYAVARALAASGILARMYSAWYTKPASLQAKIAHLLSRIDPILASRLKSRYCSELVGSQVISSPAVELRTRLWTRFCRHHPEEAYAYRRKIEAKAILRHGFGNANTLFGYVRNLPPSVAKQARDSGLIVVGDQIIAPSCIESAEQALQHERFPDWQKLETKTDDTLLTQHCEEQTWQHCHRITCASNYVRDGLTKQGVSPEKIAVIPYPFAAHESHYFERPEKTKELVVGFVGEVGLRKGAPYFVEVAKRLRNTGIRFVMVGKISVSDSIQKEIEQVVDLIGAVPRAEVVDWLKRFDLFYFPTTCEGSSAALMEAMAAGLPVITSPNSGTVVNHEDDGFIVAYDDIETVCHRIEQLASDHSKRIAMGISAQENVRNYSISRYSQELTEMLRLLHA